MRFLIIFLFIVSLISCQKEKPGFVNDFFYLRNKGADMPVHVEGNLGSGKFIIVLHGGPGGDSQIYNNFNKFFSNPLEEKYTIVYYDQRGSGTASGKYDSESLNTNQHVEDLEKLIALLNDKYGTSIKIYLMGHSWGGTLGTAFLIKNDNQNKISGWIEVDGAHNFACNMSVYKALKNISLQQIYSSNYYQKWQEIYSYCQSIDTNNFTDENISTLNRYGYEAETYLSLDGVTKSSSLDIIGVFHHLYFSGYSPIGAKMNLLITASTMFDEVKDTDLTPEMYKIKIPTLFIWGRHDYVIPVEEGINGYNAIGSIDKKMTILEYSGHSCMYNEMDEFLNELFDFVDSY